MQARALLKSLALHAVVLCVLLLMPAGPLRRSAQPDEVDVVFHPPAPPVEIPAPAIPLPRQGSIPAGPKTARAEPAPSAPATPLVAKTPGLPEGAPEVPVAEPPQQRIGKSGILAFRDQIASVADERNPVRLGATSNL